MPATKMSRWVWAMAVALLAGVGCAAPVDDDVGAQEEALHGRDLPPEIRTRLRSVFRGQPLSDEALDEAFQVDHFVRVGRGRRIHLTETMSVRSFLRWPRRAVLLLPGPVSEGSFYNLDVDGYRFADTLAAEGYFAFAVDFEGTGSSSRPENGADATHRFHVEGTRRLLPYIRFRRFVRRVDVLGESTGAAVAAELCADARRVRSCTLSSNLYRQGTPFFEAVFLDPGFLALIGSAPDGYLPAGPEFYFNITSRAAPDVAAEVLATQPGTYATAPLLEPATLPFYDPTHAAVPGLVLQGTEDNIGAQSDSDRLAADYGNVGGGVARIVRIEGAGHIPRIEPAPANAAFETAVLGFLAE